MKEVEEWRAKRNAALRALDIAFEVPGLKRYGSDEVKLIAMHKARYECTDIEPELRHQSRAWLEERGYGRFGGRQFDSDKTRLPK